MEIEELHRKIATLEKLQIRTKTIQKTVKTSLSDIQSRTLTLERKVTQETASFLHVQKQLHDPDDLAWSILMAKLVKRGHWLDKAEKRARELDLDLWGCSATSSDLIHRLGDETTSKNIPLDNPASRSMSEKDTKMPKERKSSTKCSKTRKSVNVNNRNDITLYFGNRKVPKDQKSLWSVVRAKVLQSNNKSNPIP